MRALPPILLILAACGGASARHDAPFAPGTLQGHLAAHLPSQVGSTSLTVEDLTTYSLDMQATGALRALGLDSSVVEVAVAHGDSVAILAVLTPGRAVHARLEQLARVEGAGASRVQLGRFEGALRIEGKNPVYLLDAGDTVISLQAADAGAAADALARSLSGSLGPPPSIDPAAGSFPPGPMQMVWTNLPGGVSCVGEPPGRMRWLGLAVDAYLLPRADTTFLLSATSGTVTPGVAFSFVDMTYVRDSFQLGVPDRVEVSGVSPSGGSTPSAVERSTRFTLLGQHCLQGTWRDGDSVVTLHHKGNQVEATVTSGDLCGQSSGPDFSGTLDGASLTGSDLVACYPAECVDAGVFPASSLVPFTAEVADDGQSVTLHFVGVDYDRTYDDMGKVVACPKKDATEDLSLTLDRITFGLDLPFGP